MATTLSDSDRYTIITADSHAGGDPLAVTGARRGALSRRLRRLAGRVQEPLRGPGRQAGAPALPLLGELLDALHRVDDDPDAEVVAVAERIAFTPSDIVQLNKRAVHWAMLRPLAALAGLE